MIYLQLFLEFFKIGLFSFGGGYATIPFLYHFCTSLYNFVYIIINQKGKICKRLQGFLRYFNYF